MNNSTSQRTPSSFNWADEVEATVVPIALVTPAAHAPHDFSVLRSNNWNPWGSLSCRHHCSQPCTRNSFYSCQYNTNCPHKPTAPSPPPMSLPAPIQLVETVRHPHGIAPMKPVIKTTASSLANTPSVYPSTPTPLCTDSSLQHLCALSLDWSGDPLLAGLARILEALGWTRGCVAARMPLCLRGAHGVVGSGGADPIVA